MDIAKKQKEKYDKLTKKKRVISKKMKEVEISICKAEKEKAHQDMLAFLNNIQTSNNVPDLLKKRKREADDRDPTLAIESVFVLADVFINQIVVFLGPMEFFNLCRTNKKTSALLIPAFDVWAPQFLDRIEQETDSDAFDVRKLSHLSNFELFARYKKTEPAPSLENLLIVVHQMLSQLDETFRRFRPQGTTLFQWSDLRGRTHFKPSELCNPLISVFAHNTVTGEVSRAPEHNLLFGDPDASVSAIYEHRANKFERRYGFPLTRENDENFTEYFRYSDLLDLNLTRAVENKTKDTKREIYFIDPVNATLSSKYDDDMFNIIVTRDPGPTKIGSKWKGGKLFCDEYECRSIIQRQSNELRPNYAFVSLTGTRVLLNQFINK